MSETLDYTGVVGSAPGAAYALRDTIRTHWDRRAATFDEGESRVSRTPAIYAAWKRVFSQVLGVRPLDVLDIGAGTGEVVLLLCGLGHRARGIDLSPEMTRVAAAKAAAHGVETEFSVADAENVPFREASFDVVHARHLLWTLPHPRRALADWLRVVRPGGTVLVTESTWDGGPPSPIGRIRQRVARIGARFRGERLPAPKSERIYPGPRELPFFGGLGPDGLRRFFVEEGLIDVKVIDLFWLRRMSRRSLPWYRRWMNPARTGYYAAWGRRP